MNIQLKHEDYSPASHDLDIVVILNGIQSPENIGMAFRVSDAFGVNQIILDTPIHNEKKVTRVSRNTLNIIDYKSEENLPEVIQDFKKSGFKIIGIEITNHSRNIMTCAELDAKKVVYILGSEIHGIEEEILNLCDLWVHIPHYGKNSSMNVINAMTIGLYELVRRSSN